VVTESIPLYEVGIDPYIISMLFFERVCFFIAITIPFDIRDIEVDTTNNVKTIPSTLGKNKSIMIAIFLLIFCVTIEIYLSQTTQFSGYISTIATYIITAILIICVKDKKEDYYFSGLLDGTIMLPFIFLQII